MRDLTDYYSTVGYLRAKGLDETQAYHRADEVMERPMEPNEYDMEDILTNALEEYAKEVGTKFKIRTYEEAGLLTRDNGLIVEVERSRFQITIMKA